MIQQAITKLIARLDLTRDEMAAVMSEIADGTATPALMGAFLTTLRAKGETVEEIAGAAQVMRQRAERIKVNREVFVDTCGTGGDGSNSFNISTTAAFVVAGAGVTVAKHGNRSVSSRCGSADVLAAVGVNVEASVDVVERCIDQVGIGFLFAQKLHPAFKSVAMVRRELGLRTIFNVLGPLANPAGARHQVMGVFDQALVPQIGQVLANLDAKHAFVVHGDGYDEIAVTGATTVCEVNNNQVKNYEISPSDLGLKTWNREEIKGGDITLNARIMQEVLAGSNGAQRDAVLANAAAAIVAAGVAATLAEGIKLAATSIDSGAAKNKLKELVQVSTA
ncbi:MAG: anthranilate phosphoribosyltransferase [Deltaproteobacteria bacterium]|nr:anthranilate phosphoribosyltransferase [Deltaproteobacteria bacterium]